MKRAQVLLAAIFALGGQAQTGLQTGPVTAAPSFEVASIKPDNSGGGGISLNIEQSGRFRGTGVSLKLLMENAYQVKDAQIIGAPAWLASDRFVIDAKPDEATAAEMQKLNPEQREDKLMLMLRALLEERCQLKLRKETRDLPVYALTVGKSGPKFHQSVPAAGDKSEMGHGIRFGRGEMEANDIEMGMAVDVLSQMLGRPVVDKTGLAGKYDFSLKWAPDEHEGQMFKGAGDAPAPPSAEPAGPSIFTAVQEQLGLKLEAQKSPMMVLVIDHIEKPSAN